MFEQYLSDETIMILRMDLVLCDISALEYWRCAGRRKRLSSREDARLVKRADKIIKSPGSRKVDVDIPFIPECSDPLHYLVSPSRHRLDTGLLKGHVWSKSLQANSVVHVRQDVYVSSTEFLTLQLTTQKSLIELIVLICELCGTYSLHEGADFETRNEPLMTLDSLKRFSENHSSCKGIKKLRRAISYSFENSASPMETILVLLLCLPINLGGFGLSRPLLNYRVDLPKNFKSSSGKHYFVCDLYWPEAKLALEYDSDAYHAEAQKMTDDAIRRNDLETLGITVMTATSRHVFNAEKMELLAKSLAQKLGKRPRYSSTNYLDKRYSLRAQLLR